MEGGKKGRSLFERKKVFKLAMKNMMKESNLFEITSFSEAYFAADKHDRKSLTGGVILLNGMAVSWLCKKKTGRSVVIDK